MEALTVNMLTTQKQKNKKKSQQCVCYQNTSGIGTISEAEEIMGIFYTLVSSIYSLGSLLLHMLTDLCTDMIILTNSGQ